MARDWVALGTGVGVPVGAAVFSGKTLGMALPQQQQKLGMGWHRAENPKGAAAAEAEGTQGGEPSKHVPKLQKSQLSTQKGH